MIPGAVAESVEHSPRMREIMSSNPGRVKPKTNKNGQLSLPSLVIGIITLGQELVG